MEPGRWGRITDIYHATIARPPEERASFLGEECHGDESLRKQVEAMVKSHERSGDFIESPAFAIAPELLIDEPTADLIGQSIGHYRIESFLGEGGMGEVYLARDERLGRKVALKLLPAHLTEDETQLSRFKTEARSASALNHPNILTVHEIGAEGTRQFIATEFIEGITLRVLLARGRMNLHDALEIAVQVASALAAAHETGVVHRDIKPENIMLRPDGYAKVLDFGIAKLTEQHPASDNHGVGTAKLLQTQPGVVMGTAQYMSPEQARGQTADARTDIWSLGVMLYEMVAGNPPFSGATSSDCIASILKTEPPLLSGVVPDVPLKFQSIVQKALRKNRDERYQTIKEMLVDLRSLKQELEAEGSSPQIKAHLIVSKIKRHQRGVLLAAAVAILAGVAFTYSFYFVSPAQLPSEKSVAVLPFADLSQAHDQEYFCDGIQEEILTRLSKIRDLKVISRTSTQRFKSAPENLPEIAKQLGVANIVEGSVQKNGDAVRVNVQLIKAANDSHLWADTFDRKLTDIFSVESEVAKAIADQLRAQVTGREERVITAKPTDNPEAYDAYLRGLSYILKSGNTPANGLHAQKYLREAVRLDPKFALAWALLSTVDARGYLTVNLQPTVALREEARQASETALTLEPNLGEAVLAKGYYHYACLKDYDTAVSYFEQARQSLPNSSRIPASLAYVARRRGEWDQTESYFNEAERLDPLNVSLLGQHAASYIILRRFPEALRKLDQVLSLTPDDQDALAAKAAIAQAEGDLPRASAILAPLHPLADAIFPLETQVYQTILERRPGQIIPRLKEILAKPDPGLGYLNGQLRFWLGWAQEVAGDHAAAQESWRQARSELELLLKEQPENYLLIGDLALTNMGLGDKAAALALAERAMAANPIEKDAVSGPISLEILARVAAQAAEPDRAIAALQKLLSTPYDGALAAGIPLTPALLRIDPMWDPLRNDPRFERLVASAASIPEKSIAVLPFENRSEDKANAYFADGVQDEILTRLSKIEDLKVISHTSSQRYKGTSLSLAEIAKQLGVANLLEGSVQKTNNKVRVNVQLIRAANDSHLWAETYDRKLTDIFAVETEIAKAIAENLAAKLTHTEERAVSVKPTNNLAAYELYLQGRYFWNRRDREGFRRAIELFTKATELDPNYALAYAGIADTYALLPIYGFASARDSFPKAKVAALRALQLDDTLAEAHVSYGNVLLSDFDWVRSRREFERAIELNPNYATAHQWLGSDNLMDSGELDRGLAEVRRARELDPLSPIVNTVLAIAHYSRREYADAVTQFHKTFEIDPNFLLAHAMLGQTLAMQGAIDEGIAEVQKARQINGDVGLLSILGYAYARKGDREQALKILDQMKAESQKEFVPAVDFAILYIGLGDKEQALDWLEKGYEDRSSNIIKVDPICDPLHGDPRYERLVARIFSEKPAGADF